jgi:Leucine-rich repeat (LRR) protein
MKRFVYSLFFGQPILGLVIAFWLGALTSARAQAPYNTVDDQVELEALQQLFAATNGANWANTQRNDHVWVSGSGISSEDTSIGPRLKRASIIDFSTWYGVTVTNGDVTGLNLTRNRLAGQLPEELGNLTALQELRLAENQLTAGLPNSMGNLTQLTVLELHRNTLSDRLPEGAYYWQNLQTLNLAQNKFSGELTSLLLHWPQLRYLNLEHNKFAELLPTASTLPKYLEFIDVSHNSFSGHWLMGWGQLAKLTYLDLSVNQLSGGLPADWSDAPSLQELYLAGNRFSGPIPAARVKTPLTRLDMSSNQFAGLLPATLLQITSLIHLNVADNRLVGTLPNARAAQSLISWRAGGNGFSGNLPMGLGRLASLMELDLSHNQLSGLLPDSLAQATTLTDLNLADNRLRGELPPAWTNLPALVRLDISNNQLTGNIPAFTAAAQSGWLRLAYNRFTGLASMLYLNPVTLLDVRGNYLDAAALEANLSGPPVEGQAQHPFEAYLYAPQLPGPADTVSFLHGATLHLHREMAGQHISSYLWARELGGQWYPLTGQTTTDLILGGAAEADQGYYHVAVTDAWLPGLTLQAPWVYADLVPYAPLPENRPVDGPTPPLAALDAPVWRNSPADSVNYVRSFVPQLALTDPAQVSLVPAADVQVSTTYLDGLGRKVQTVQHAYSPMGHDVVQPHAYDSLGREPRQYLPYVTNTGSGHYHPNALYEQYFFYRDAPTASNAAADIVRTGVAYSENLLEPSPLGRVTAQAAPGEAWSMQTGRIASRQERPNTLLDSVQWFMPLATGSDLRHQGSYAPGTLWGVANWDENQHCSIEWKDEQGRVVLRQVEVNRTKNAQHQTFTRWLRTYYLYDAMGHLRMVLPPEAVKELQAHQWQLTTAAERLLFRYRYDDRGRLAAKQVPGTDGETWIVYNLLDQPVLTQDAGQRARGEWSFTKYDILGRPVLTGLLTRPGQPSQEDLQAEADQPGTAQRPNNNPDPTPDNLAPQWEERRANLGGNFPYGYTLDRAYPRSGQQGFAQAQVLTITYYDDYNFNNEDYGRDDAFFDTTATGPLAPAPVANSRAMGQVTRTRVRVLGLPASAPGAWLTTTTFYDERGRLIQAQSTNARGEQDVVTNRLDFAGRLLQTYSIHHGPNLPAAGVRVLENRAYDHAGRLSSIGQQLGDEAQPTPVASLHYNELGQLTRKTLGQGALLQHVDYGYNTRGWLTHLNDAQLSDSDDLFGLELCYEQGFTNGYAQYNGNLTGQKWRSRADGIERAYGYAYDFANRLLQGDFVARTASSNTTGFVARPNEPTPASWSAEANNYRLSFVSYDDNGNVRTLRRRGLLAEATRTTPRQFGLVDQLSYTYDGNRLRAVTDLVTTNELPRATDYHGAPTSLAGDFQEQGVRLSQEYFYDANGSLTQDKNKGISNIAYNHLHLPTRIHFGTGADSLVFRYAATGQKVAKLVYQTGRPVQRTDYLGAYQYEQDTLRFFPHPEGRILPIGHYPAGLMRYQREFTIKDHLGNLRLAYRAGQRTIARATLEQGDAYIAARERKQFDSLSVSPPVAAYVGNLARTGQYVARLNAGGSAPQPLGVLRQLRVQKGDTVSITAPGYYPQPVEHSSFVFSLASFVVGLLQQPPASPTPGDGGSRMRTLPLLSIGISAGLPALLPSGNGTPLGYVRLLVFDRDSNLVSSQTQQLSTAAASGYERLALSTTVAQDGYVTVFVGNESNVDVYFDDVMVRHGQGLQVQETEYDPMGLVLAGLGTTSPGLRQLNQYQWNGKELQPDLGLNWTSLDWRMYDAQLNRMPAVDPEMENGQEHMSPYAFGFDNAVRFADANGRKPNDSETRPGPGESASSAPCNTSRPAQETTTTRENRSIKVVSTESNSGHVVDKTSTLSGSTQNVANVSNHSAEVIASSMRQADVKKADITSTYRNPTQEAAAMYTNADKPGGLQKGYRLYAAAGDKVLKTYETAKAAGLDRAQIIDKMAARITKIGPTVVSHHGFSPSERNVIDISAITIGSRGRVFSQALSSNAGISTVFSPFTPHQDPAFHVEIKP